MGLSHSPNMVTDALIVCFDAANTKSYPGTGNTIYDLSSSRADGTATTISTTTAAPGTVIDHSTSTAITCNFTAIPNNAWSISYLGRGTATPPSNYRNIWRLYDTNNVGYFLGDTRTTTTPYILHYIKDFTLSSWNTYGIVNSTDYPNYEWNVLDLVFNGSNFKSYKNGALVATTTITVTLTGYVDVDELRLNGSGSDNFQIQHFKLYSKVLTDDEVMQNYQALRGRAGI